MTSNKIATHVPLAKALSMGSPPEGNLAIPIFKHGSMEAELYTPEKIDSQVPHSRDEIYLVASGKGEFFDGEKDVQIQEGSFIFVPAGVDHRFKDFTDNFSVWVFFYGPEGGEQNA